MTCPRVMTRWTRRIALILPVALTASGALASESGGGGFSPGDLGQAIAAIVIFLLLLAVLGKYAWKPIVTQMRQREEDIASALANAEKRQKESQDLLAQYKARLDQAEKDSQDVLAQARKDAGDARDAILNTAHKEAERFTHQARQDIEQAKQSALHELYDATAELATDLAGKIIRKNLRPQDQQDLLKESLADMRKNVSRNS